MANLVQFQQACWTILETLQQLGVTRDEKDIAECGYCGRQQLCSWVEITHTDDCPITQISDLIVDLENDIAQRQIVSLVLWPEKEAS